jgi:hypothetical protein
MTAHTQKIGTVLIACVGKQMVGLFSLSGLSNVDVGEEGAGGARRSTSSRHRVNT